MKHLLQICAKSRPKSQFGSPNDTSAPDRCPMPFAIKRFSWLSWSGYTDLKAQSLVFTQKSNDKFDKTWTSLTCISPNPWIEIMATFSLPVASWAIFSFPLQAFNDRVVNFQADLRNKNDQTCIFIRLSAVHSQGKSNIFSVRFFWSQFSLIHWSGTRIWVFQLTDPKSSPCPRAWTWAFQYRPNLGREQWPWDWKARSFLKGGGSK